MLKTHGRYDYSAISKRQDYSFPGGKRLAIAVRWQQSLGNIGGRLGPRPRRTFVEQTQQRRRHSSQYGEDDEACKQCGVNPKVKASHQLCAFANT